MPMPRLSNLQDRQSEPFPVTYGNTDKLGLLGEDCADLAKFHSQMRGIRATVFNAEDGFFANAKPEDIAVVFERELELWQNTVRLGRSLAKRFREYQIS